MSLQPPIPYYGSKGLMAPWIARLLPPHEHYIEAFAGSLAVLLAKPPSTLETINDLDGHLVTFWRVVRDHPDELVGLIDATPHSRQEYADASELDGPLSDVERARRVFTRIVQGRMSALAKTGWRNKVDGAAQASHIADELQRFRNRIIIAARRIQRVQIENMPALDLIARYGQDRNNLVYADPPYLAETRSSVGHYRIEMPHPEQHVQLAAVLHDCAAAVVLSGYRSPLYDQLYAGWYVEEWPTQTVNGGTRKATCEVLWSNRPLGGRVQEALFTL